MFDELKTFVLFAEEGSLQKVALRLPLTQPAVTRQIQRLEQRLGLQLLDRRQKPPVLTPQGLEVLARSREIIRAFEELKTIAGVPEPEGVFRLGLVNGLANESLAEGFAAVVARFPHVSLRLKSGWSAELAEQHRLGLLDAAIVLSDGSQFYDAEKIGVEELVVVGSSGLPVSEKEEQTAWVLGPEPCDARRSLVGRLAQNNRPLIVVAEIEHPGLQIGLIRQGLGLGLLPKRLIGEIRPAGIEEIDALGGPLHLNVMMLRSPHLGSLKKVADAVATETSAFVAKSKNAPVTKLLG